MKDNVGRYRTQSLFREFYVHTSTGLSPCLLYTSDAADE